jgi:hypothetical protein
LEVYDAIDARWGVYSYKLGSGTFTKEKKYHYRGIGEFAAKIIANRKLDTYYVELPDTVKKLNKISLFESQCAEKAALAVQYAISMGNNASFFKYANIKSINVRLISNTPDSSGTISSQDLKLLTFVPGSGFRIRATLDSDGVCSYPNTEEIDQRIRRWEKKRSEEQIKLAIAKADTSQVPIVRFINKIGEIWSGVTGSAEHTDRMNKKLPETISSDSQNGQEVDNLSESLAASPATSTDQAKP